jgi:ArsR family transcriptional regulator, arsenate/arsenite/antimonite-responsive transcriptional repressor
MLRTTVSHITIYQCLCDPTRLRILSLLGSGELCVCHFQEILGEPQVKVSKHLAYLRAHGLVESRKEANWMVYRLPAKPSHELSANLACLQDCARENAVFRRDAEKRCSLEAKFVENSPLCCAPLGSKTKANRPRT